MVLYVFLQPFAHMEVKYFDKKTPLLRSMEAINKSAVRLLHLLGETDVKKSYYYSWS